MNLEQQVCSLELAKLLKELGVKQESAFWWEQTKLAGRNIWSKEWALQFNNYSEPYNKDHIVSAFTAVELGDMLPITIDAGTAGKGISSELLSIHKGTFEKGDRWQVMYYDVNFCNAVTEADARAKMLIYLLKKNLLSLQP